MFTDPKFHLTINLHSIADSNKPQADPHLPCILTAGRHALLWAALRLMLAPDVPQQTLQTLVLVSSQPRSFHEENRMVLLFVPRFEKMFTDDHYRYG